MKNDEIEILFKKYYNDAFLYVLSLAKSKEVAEDIVASAFYKALASKEAGVINFKAWLFVVCRNMYYYSYNRGKKYQEVELRDDLGDEKVIAIIDNIIVKEEYKLLYRAIRLLPSNQQEVVILFYFEELKSKDIARVLNTSVANIKVLLYRARKSLRKILEGYYEV